MMFHISCFVVSVRLNGLYGVSTGLCNTATFEHLCFSLTAVKRAWHSLVHAEIVSLVHAENASLEDAQVGRMRSLLRSVRLHTLSNASMTYVHSNGAYLL